MYCPSCGKENSAEQKFCRSCGLSLEKTVQSLAEQLPAVELDKKLRDRQRRVDRWLAIVAALGITGFVGAILWAIIYKIIILKRRDPGRIAVPGLHPGHSSLCVAGPLSSVIGPRR